MRILAKILLRQLSLDIRVMCCEMGMLWESFGVTNHHGMSRCVWKIPWEVCNEPICIILVKFVNERDTTEQTDLAHCRLVTWKTFGEVLNFSVCRNREDGEDWQHFQLSVRLVTGKCRACCGHRGEVRVMEFGLQYAVCLSVLVCLCVCLSVSFSVRV